MRLRIVMSTVAALALLAPAAHAGVPKSARGVALTACEHDSGAGDGVAVFDARMRSLPRTERMQLRFTLQVRTPERRRYTTISAPGFNTWSSADPGTSRYTYTKRVENLIAPGSYRVRVRFRWLDANGDIVRSARVNSPACRQPDPRPDLSVRSVGIQSTAQPNRKRYVAFVRNTGRSSAGASSLVLTVGGALLGTMHVAGLEPGEGTLVSVEGPSCAAGDEIVAEADADDSVDERDEADNRFSRFC